MASGVDVGAIGTIVDKVTFVHKVPLLLKATSDDDQPTPGYMYGEINKLTLDSGSYCQTLLDFLVDRLNKDSCHVKLKVLRILKYLVENGHPDFRQGLRRKPYGITQAIKHSGPADPLHGNALYHMVRQAATELSQVLFEVGEDDGDLPHPTVTPMRSTGGMGSSQQEPGSMQGFGSTVPMSRSLGGTIVSGLRDIADRVAETQVSPVHKPQVDTVGFYKPPSVPTTPDSVISPLGGSTGPVEPSMPKRHVPVHRPGRAGGGWDDSDEEELALPQRVGSSPGGSMVTPGGNSQHSSQSNRSQGSGDLSARVGGLQLDDWARESTLVADFAVKPGLTKRHELEAFMKNCSSLNCEKVVGEIAKRLICSSQENELMRLMLVVERLLRSDVVNLDFITQICAPPLIKLFKASAGPPKAKARKIIRVMEKLSPLPGVFDEMVPIHQRGNMTLNNSCEPLKPSLIDMPNSSTSTAGLLDVDSRSSPEWNNLRIPFGTSDNAEQGDVPLQLGSTDSTNEAINFKSGNFSADFASPLMQTEVPTDDMPHSFAFNDDKCDGSKVG